MSGINTFAKKNPQMMEHIVSFAKEKVPDLYHQRYISGKLYDGQTFVMDLIDSYDNWLDTRLPIVLHEYVCRLSDGSGQYVRVDIDSITYDRPSIEVSDTLRGDSTHRTSRDLYPKEAREKDLTYAVRIRGSHVIYNSDATIYKVLPNRVIGEVPCMLGSKYCHLRDKSDQEKLEMGECHNDPMGYFIVKGREFTMNIQCNLLYNQPILFNMQDAKDKKIFTVLRTTALTPNSTFINDVKMTTSRSLVIETIVGGIKIGLNPFQVMKLLWDETIFGPFSEAVDSNPMINIILSMIPEQNRYRAKNVILSTYSNFLQVGTSDRAMYEDIIDKRNTAFSSSERSGVHRDISIPDIIEDLDRFLYAHANPYSFQPLSQPEYKGYVRSTKIMYLAYSVGVYAQFLSGDLTVDDRNDWSAKQLSNVGIMFEKLFFRIIKNIYSRFDDSSKKASAKDFESANIHIEVLDKFQYAFENNIWVVAANQRAKNEDKNVVLEKERNILAHYSSLTRINIPASPKGGQAKVRAIHLSQLRFVCIWETPEGDRAGLIMAKGSSAVISKQLDDSPIFAYLYNTYRIYLLYVDEYPIQDEQGNTTTLDYTNRTTPCILNGRFIGFCDVEELRYNLLTMKRGGAISEETSISFKHGALFISTMGGRPLCPTLVVGDGTTTLNGFETIDGELVLHSMIKQGLVTSKTSYKELITNGCIEYIDPMEQSQERVVLAQTVDDFRFHRARIEALSNKADRTAQDEVMLLELLNKRYTYCEITPSSLMGIAASIIPLPNTNQPARNVYQASMGKQAQGIYHSNACNRLDREAKMLTYPARPIFSTEVSSRIGLDDMPSGETVTVAVLTDPNSQEDAITFKKSSIDRGLFNSVVYKTHRVVLKSSNEISDELTNEPNKKLAQSRPQIYRNLQANGLPIVGSYMDDGDCIIGIRHFELGKTNREPRDNSLYLTRDEAGVVEKVFLHKASTTNMVIGIKIRTIRVPIPGDKFASRHAQKGTMGAELPDEDMPFDRNGVSPDIIYNSHGMPSRMTLGKPIEFIVSKLGAMSGRNFDASAFSSLNVDTFARALTAYGFSRKGTKVLYDGVTGRLISSYQLEQEETPQFLPDIITYEPYTEQKFERFEVYNEKDDTTGTTTNTKIYREFDADKTIIVVTTRRVVYHKSNIQRANLIPCQVFVGPCYYQRLRHEVIEKGHERGLEGKIDQRTQLPSGGKSKTGIATSAALRFGEMERDALISYGSSSLARERMITLADDYTLVVCTECGTEAAFKKDIGFMCRNCKCDKFGKLKVPYSILIFRRLLSGMNVNIKFAVEKVPEEQRTRR